jgi:hypothetical protein
VVCLVARQACFSVGYCSDPALFNSYKLVVNIPQQLEQHCFLLLTAMQVSYVLQATTSTTQPRPSPMVRTKRAVFCCYTWCYNMCRLLHWGSCSRLFMWASRQIASCLTHQPRHAASSGRPSSSSSSGEPRQAPPVAAALPEPLRVSFGVAFGNAVLCGAQLLMQPELGVYCVRFVAQSSGLCCLLVWWMAW